MFTHKPVHALLPFHRGACMVLGFETWSASRSVRFGCPLFHDDGSVCQVNATSYSPSRALEHCRWRICLFCITKYQRCRLPQDSHRMRHAWKSGERHQRSVKIYEGYQNDPHHSVCDSGHSHGWSDGLFRASQSQTQTWWSLKKQHKQQGQTNTKKASRYPRPLPVSIDTAVAPHFMIPPRIPWPQHRRPMSPCNNGVLALSGLQRDLIRPPPTDLSAK